jgi:large subunit ribosomal protein L19
MKAVLKDKQISPVNVAARRAMDIRAGDTVRVHQKITELKTGKGANKKEVTTKNTRIQVFEGLVIARKHHKEAGGTVTVRAVLSGVGVEKVFPLYSPVVEKMEVVRRAKVRRAKLYHIREKASREVKRQLRTIRKVSEAAQAAEAAALTAATEEVATVQEEAAEADVKEMAAP